MTHIKEYWMKAVAAGHTELSLAEWEKQQAKHTPGPWRGSQDPEDSCYYRVSASNWGGFARVVVKMREDAKPDPVGEANLRLILKAPEMLAKLKEVVKLLDRSQEFAAGSEGDDIADFIREIDPTY